jgi:hypothetical protein
MEHLHILRDEHPFTNALMFTKVPNDVEKPGFPQRFSTF